jgi:hypothetical protein
MTLRAAAADYDGNNIVRAFGSGANPAAVAAFVYGELTEKGAMNLVLAGQR